MKKQIEIRHKDSVHLICAEIYRYKEYIFGLYWDSEKFRFTAVEVSTGLVASSLTKYDTRSPRAAVIDRITTLVDEGEMERGIARARRAFRKRVTELKSEVSSIQKQISDYERMLNIDL